ncbi:MAG: hypothetical protein IKM48_08555 [Clostridia bacterium]|nr:hypothetical protein [Clostridia bacterium]
MTRKEKNFGVALCRALCENSQFCDWFTAADFSDPKGCYATMDEVVAAIQSGRLHIDRSILRKARRYVRKKERDFRKHPEYLDCIRQKETPPDGTGGEESVDVLGGGGDQFFA